MRKGKDDMRRGIDVSHHQGRIDWRKVAASGIDWAYQRMQYGLTVDREWAHNWEQARGLLDVGAYVYFLPHQGALVQAEWLCELLSMGGAGTLPVVLDIETGKPDSAEVQEWLRYVEMRTSKTPRIYGSAGVLPSLIGTDERWARYGLWVADYGRPVGQPRVPKPWLKWEIHQYTDKGVVPGIKGFVDMNVCRGTP